MYGPRYVWVIIGDYVEHWWTHAADTACTRQQLETAANGYFSIDSLNSLSDDDRVRGYLNVFLLLNGQEDVQFARTVN